MSVAAIAGLALLGGAAVAAAYAITAAANALSEHDVDGMPLGQFASHREAERLGRGDERATVHAAGNTPGRAGVASGNGAGVSRPDERMANRG